MQSRHSKLFSLCSRDIQNFLVCVSFLELRSGRNCVTARPTPNSHKFPVKLSVFKYFTSATVFCILRIPKVSVLTNFDLIFPFLEFTGNNRFSIYSKCVIRWSIPPSLFKFLMAGTHHRSEYFIMFNTRMSCCGVAYKYFNFLIQYPCKQFAHIF